MSIRDYEYKQEQARQARQEARELREMHKIANCGLAMRIQYGTYDVPKHVAMRVADQFPIWADEYEAVASQIESEMEAMFSMTTELDAKFEAIPASGQAALDKTRGVFPSQVRVEDEEVEWEYGVYSAILDTVTGRGERWMSREHASRVTACEGENYGVRRRKAGPWLPVEN